MKNHTLILGLGNPLMADDGAGVQVVERLHQCTLPSGVEVRDGGTGGIGLVPELDGYRRVILVDCALMGAHPGTWRRLLLRGTGEADLISCDEAPLSLHHFGLQHALRLADASGILPPEVVLFGIQPAHVEWDRPMSEEVQAAVPAVVRAVLDDVAEICRSNRSNVGQECLPCLCDSFPV